MIRGLTALTLAFALVPVIAFAGDDKSREIDFTQRLIAVDGKPIWECKVKPTKPMLEADPNWACPEDQKNFITLGDAAGIALEANLDADRSMDPLTKYKNDQLARKIYQNAHAVLPVEDIATIKDRIGKAFGPAYVGATWPLLDPTLK